MKQIYDKPKCSWHAQVGERTHYFWHLKQWHMFNHMGNSSVGKVTAQTVWAVLWYKLTGLVSWSALLQCEIQGRFSALQVDVSFTLRPQNMLFSHLPSGQGKKKQTWNRNFRPRSETVGVLYCFWGQLQLLINLPPGSRGFLLYELLNLTRINMFVLIQLNLPSEWEYPKVVEKFLSVTISQDNMEVNEGIRYHLTAAAEPT